MLLETGSEVGMVRGRRDENSDDKLGVMRTVLTNYGDDNEDAWWWCL